MPFSEWARALVWFSSALSVRRGIIENLINETMATTMTTADKLDASSSLVAIDFDLSFIALAPPRIAMRCARFLS